MFKLNLKPVPFSQIDPDALDTEIANGFEANKSFSELSITGQYSDTTFLAQRSSHIGDVFHYLYSYLEKAELTPSHKEDDLLDALGFVANSRINGELYTGDTPNNLEHLLALAFARAKIDTINGDIKFDLEALTDWFESEYAEFMSLSEIAALANMDEQSVRNATQADSKNHLHSEKFDNRIHIPVDVAARWLVNRSGYVRRKPSQNEIPEDHLLVPFAKDGSFFSKACKQTAGFKIGKKGDEQYITDFDQALIKLKAMPVAYWRRPNPNGRFGIVRAVEWKVIASS